MDVEDSEEYRWRTESRAVIANLLECCEICYVVREKDNLVPCVVNPSAWLCKTGYCIEKHQMDFHPFRGCREQSKKGPIRL